MPNIRIFVRNQLSNGKFIELSKEQAHYLCNVMRQKQGDEIEVFNGIDGEYKAKIAQISKKSCELELLEHTKLQKNSPDIWLCFAPVKNAPINNMIQKATELGAGKLVPVITERTIVSRVNTDRLQANAIEAAEQSRRLDVPEIAEPIKFKQLLESWPDDRKLILCDESGGGKPFLDAVKGIKNEKFAIIIGPEGGFSQTEFEIMRSKPYIISVGMGPRILRADTAALAALTCYMSILGDWNDPPRFVETA